MVIIYSIYQISTGNIIKYLTTEENTIQYSLLEGESYVEGKYDHESYYIVDGVPTLRSSEELSTIETEKLIREHRLVRNGLLKECDWTQNRDVSESVSLLWQPYRQALRDITSQVGFPKNIEWPTKPA